MRTVWQVGIVWTWQGLTPEADLIRVTEAIQNLLQNNLPTAQAVIL